jgi:autotransporter-associated beta strand protein
MKLNRRNLFLASSATITLTLSAPVAHAQRYWDGNGTSSGFGTAGGTWGDLGSGSTTGNATQGWTTSNTGTVATTNYTTTTSDSLFFGNGTSGVGLGAGTININGSVSSGNMTFSSNNGNITFTGGNLTLGTLAANSTVTVGGGASVGVTMGSNIIGGNLTKAGTGTLVLTGSNAFTGQVGATAGVLRLASLNAASGSTLLRLDNAGTRLEIATDTSFSGPGITLGGSSVIVSDVFTAGNAGVTHSLGNATFSNAGTLNQSFIAGSNVSGGNATIQVGNLSLSGGGGGTLTLNPTTSNLVITGNVAGTTTGVNTLVLSGTGSVNSIGGNITNGLRTTQNITKSGNSIWTLNGTSSAYTGATTINEGILSVNTIANGGSVSGIGNSTSANTNLVLGGGTLRYTGGNTTSNRSFTLTAGTTSTIDNGLNSDLSFVGANGTATTGALTKTGAGTLTLTGANTYNGTTTISGGALQLGNGGTTGAIDSASAVVNEASLIVNRSNAITMGSAISGNGSLTKLGAGTLTLTANTSYTGTTTISGGTLQIGNAADSGSIGSSSNIVNDGTLTYNVAAGNRTYGNVISGSGALTKLGAGGSLTLSGNNSYAGATNVNAGTLIVSHANALGTTAGATSVATNQQLQLQGGVVFAAETLNLLSNSGGNTVLLNGSGNNEWTGTIASASVAAGNTINISANSGSNLLISGGMSSLGAPYSLRGDGNITISGVIADGSVSPNITGVISGAGTGVRTLTNINTYSANTTVSGGKLTVASTGTINNTAAVLIGAGEFNYNSATALSQAVSFTATGGKLSGNGTITPAVNITAGNTLAPGNSIGTMSFGSGLTLGGNYSVELGTSNTAGNPAAGLSDRAVVTGALGLGGTLQLVDNAGADGLGSMGAGAYRIATSTGATTGTFASVSNAANATLHEKVIYGSNTVDLELYRLATGSTGNATLGKARVGGSLTGSLTTTNTATADGFSENLNASVGTNAGDVNASSGSASGLIAGASSSTISVGLDTTSSGAKSGSVLVSYVSDGTGTSGHGTTSNGSQTVGVSGSVYELASADLGQSGGPSITGIGPSYTLNFGSLLALNTLYTASFSIQNGVVTNSFIDTLTGDYSLISGSPEFATNAVDFSGLAAGAAANLFNITFFTTSAGTFSGSFGFDGTSVQSGLADLSVGDFTIALSAQAIPEPNVAALLGGLGTLALLRRRRNS